MSVSDRPSPVPLAECTDVYGLLDQVRLRPGMWVRGRTLRELETTLWGYGMALEIHGVREPFPFGPRGGFGEWLYARFGWGTTCGWAFAIEQNAGTEDPLAAFFRLANEYRVHQQAERQPSAVSPQRAFQGGMRHQ